VARFLDAVGEFFAKAWKRLEIPLVEMFIHVVLTVAALIGLSSVEYLLTILGLGKEVIPVVHILFRDLILILDVIAITLIIGVGIIKAVWEVMK
jgi:hypothetical protein